MSQEVLVRAIARIAEHVSKHQIRRINLIFHGGEPLLAGPQFFRTAVAGLRASLGSGCSVTFGVQSNGTLVNESWLELFRELGITVGISVDGPALLNDRFRVDYRGRSTSKEVERALTLLQLPEYAGIGSGLLCVIQPDSDPVALLDWFRQWGDNRVDFLFPHHNHLKPPPFPHGSDGYGFGTWLARAFDHWWRSDMANLRVRIFEDIIHLLLGGYFTVESLGLSPVRIAVVQTDGAYEALDSLKSTFDGAVDLEAGVYDAPLDAVLNRDLVRSRIQRAESLCATCTACRYANVCGGGYVPHRYHQVHGFDMPSVYCDDLMFLISHIEHALRSSERPEIVSRLPPLPTVSS